MAIYNEILSGRYNRALQKIFAIKGSPPVRQLGGEVTPVHFLFSGAENRFLEQWNRFAAQAGLALAVGNQPTFQLRNPVTSGVVAVVERLSINRATADTGVIITQDTNKAAFTNASGQRCLDNRPVAGSTTTLGASCQTTSQIGGAVTGGVLAIVAIAAGVEFAFIQTYNQEIPILPGDSLVIAGSAAGGADTMRVNFLWRERALEESEQK